jgi:hypothetical protein
MIRSGDPASSPEFEEFRSRSVNALSKLREERYSSVFEKALHAPARWHPYGFAVFHLGSYSELGRLRFHVWPSNLRVELLGHPRVHRHGWHLVSHVICGNYTDLLFEGLSSRPRGLGWQSMHACKAENRGGLDYFTPLEEKYYVRQTENRLAVQGEFHTIPSGIFHDTTIAHDVLVATLLFTSIPMGPPPVLLSPEKTSPSTYERPFLSEEERKEASHQVELAVFSGHA